MKELTRVNLQTLSGQSPQLHDSQFTVSQPISFKFVSLECRLSRSAIVKEVKIGKFYLKRTTFLLLMLLKSLVQNC